MSSFLSRPIKRLLSAVDTEGFLPEVSNAPTNLVMLSIRFAARQTPANSLTQIHFSGTWAIHR